MVEQITDTDDELTTRFLDGDEFTVDELRAALRRAVILGKAHPVYCGSALRNKGVQLVLDAVVDYLPSPLDVPPVEGLKPGTEDQIVVRTPDDDAPSSALAFKIGTDPYVCRLAYIRVYSGKVSQGAMVHNSTQDS